MGICIRYVLSRNKKNNVYPCEPQFYYTNVGLKGGHNYIGMVSYSKTPVLLYKCRVEGGL